MFSPMQFKWRHSCFVLLFTCFFNTLDSSLCPQWHSSSSMWLEYVCSSKWEEREARGATSKAEKGECQRTDLIGFLKRGMKEKRVSISEIQIGFSSLGLGLTLPLSGHIQSCQLASRLCPFHPLPLDSPPSLSPALYPQLPRTPSPPNF